MMDGKSGCVVVLTTLEGGDDAHSLASILVTERLAACVNVLGEMDSVYRWKGSVENAKEMLMVIKTTKGRLAELEREVKRLHSYEVPEFVVLPIAAGSREYLGWLEESVKA